MAWTEKILQLGFLIYVKIHLKVMCDPNEICKGGFVAISTVEEASRALSEMEGEQVFQVSRFSNNQFLLCSRAYPYPPGRDVSVGYVPYDIGHGMQMRDAGGISQPILIGALTSALANASPDERLYPLVLKRKFMCIRLL